MFCAHITNAGVGKPFQQMFQDHQRIIWQLYRRFATQKYAAITAAYAILTEDEGRKEAGGVLI
jgi:hypothetical protein